MSVSQADVVDYIKNLKLVEVQELIKVLEDTLGVEASAPVAMVAGGAAGPADLVYRDPVDGADYAGLLCVLCTVAPAGFTIRQSEQKHTQCRR